MPLPSHFHPSPSFLPLPSRRFYRLRSRRGRNGVDPDLRFFVEQFHCSDQTPKWTDLRWVFKSSLVFYSSFNFSFHIHIAIAAYAALLTPNLGEYCLEGLKDLFPFIRGNRYLDSDVDYRLFPWDIDQDQYRLLTSPREKRKGNLKFQKHLTAKKLQQ